MAVFGAPLKQGPARAAIRSKSLLVLVSTPTSRATSAQIERLETLDLGRLNQWLYQCFIVDENVDFNDWKGKLGCARGAQKGQARGERGWAS